MPQDFGRPVHEGASALALPLAAKTENFLLSRLDPQCGQGVPSHFEERTNTSLSRSQPAQWNS